MADETTTEAPVTEEAPDTAEATKPTADQTLLQDGGDTTDAPEAAAPSAFPDDWREQLAGEDEAALKMLKRLGSPAGLLKKVVEQEKVIRSGRHKAPLTADASPEELAEFRKANGIPDDPKGYADALDGLVIGDEDKADVDAFFEKMHAANASPEQVKLAVSQFYEMQEARAARIAEQDREFRQSSIDTLREAMGGDYRANMNDLKAWLGSQEGMLEAFSAARGADGRLLGDNPAVINFLVSQMREINPLSTVVGSGQAGVQGLKDEIAKYNAMMGDPNSPYWKDPAIQERYRALLAAEERQNARAA